jgi:RNA polymerase sigma-70 factor (ECF subfamily)
VPAITAAFLEHHHFLRKFLSRFLATPQDIEDVAQETYLRAFIAGEKTTIQQPKAYLFRTARNIALSKLTRKSRQMTDYIADISGEELPAGGVPADIEAEAEQSLGIFCEAVAALPEKCRQAFLLRKVHGLSHKEIATRMGLSVSSVEKYLRKGGMACSDYIRRREQGVPYRNEAVRKPRSEGRR